ncbi:MAG: PEP-CTERM sorting domain-containing protein [Verrucomicrobia bacterium]|nr:PEP-CTERM sorting domain-containing protein [Verrucomicrobiota bacterium]
MAVFTSAGAAQTLNYTGTAHATNLTAISWVAGSTMWGTVQTAAFTGTTQSGFTSLASVDLSLLTFNFTNLDLNTYQSPGGATSGFERYTASGSATFEVRYNGALWATGTPVFLRTEVDNNLDTHAIGTGSAFLTGAGTSSSFYDEVMSKTSGSGILNFTITDFYPVDAAGNFASVGSMTISAVPEPGAYAAIAGGLGLGFATWRRRLRRPGASRS